MFFTPWNDPARTPLYLMMVYFAGYFMLRTLLVFTPVHIWSRRAGRRVYRMLHETRREDIVHAARSFVVDVVLLSVLVKSQIARVDDTQWAFTLVASFVVLEVWFYTLHRALHHPRLFFIHRAHHGARTTAPLTGMAFSVLERTLIVLGFAAGIGAVSFVHPIAPSGIALYFFLNYVLNMIGHSNVEIFSPRLRWLVTPTHHAMHHARYDGHFSLHLTCLDRWLETEFSDYATVHARVWAGDPLTTFAERCEPVDVALRDLRAGTRALSALVDADSLRPRRLLDVPATRRWLEPQVQEWLANGVERVGIDREWYVWSPLEGPLTAGEISQLVENGALAPDTIVFSPAAQGALRAGEMPAAALPLKARLYVNRRHAREKLVLSVSLARAGVAWSGTTLDVSREGAALVLDTRAPLVPGDVVTLEHGGLSLTATVVTTQPHENTLRCALAFAPMRTRQRAGWQKVLRRGPVALSA